MDDYQITPPQESQSTKNEGNYYKLAFFILLALVITSIVAISSYLLGRNASDTSDNQTHFPFPTSDTTLSPAPTSLTPPPRLSPSVSGSPSPSPLSKQLIISASANLDGYRSSNGGGSSKTDIRVGRDVNLVSRGFVSFDLSDLPSKPNVKEATLRLYQVDIEGIPYSIGDSVVVDHLNYGDSLDTSDYANPAILSSFSKLSTNTRHEWKEVDVTTQVRDDVSVGRSQSQFRLHFEKELTGGTESGDFVHFESAENYLKSGNTPQLVIKYL